MKLLGIGDNVLDDYRWRQELYPGGNSVNVPVLARRYDGSTAAYIGVLADDGAGLHFASALREEGVDISRVRVMHGISARNYIELDEAGDRHFVGNNGRETAQYQALLCLTPGDYAMMEQYDLAHTSIHSWLDAYHPAISRRVPLSLDFSGEYDRVNIAQLCPLLRFAFFSGGAASEEEVRALARTALDAGARTVVVTMGVRGSYLLEQGREHRQECVRADVVDALGAPIDDAGDIRGKAAGGDERDRPFERLGQARIQPLGHGREAEQETVVQARHRAPSYNGHIRVRRQRNTRKLRRARSQRPERGHDAGADQSAEVGVSGNAVEVRRRAVVHGHHGTDIRQQAACPESPDETVGPHFIGPLIAVFQRNGQIPVREPGRQLKETFAGMGHQRVHAGDDRTDHAPVERHIARPGPGRAESGMTEQIGKLKAKPVAALLGIRRQRIGGHKPLYARYAYLQGRIADVDEQRVHGYLSHVWGAASRFQSATACRTSSALAGSSSFL